MLAAALAAAFIPRDGVRGFEVFDPLPTIGINGRVGQLPETCAGCVLMGPVVVSLFLFISNNTFAAVLFWSKKFEPRLVRRISEYLSFSSGPRVEMASPHRPAR